MGPSLPGCQPGIDIPALAYRLRMALRTVNEKQLQVLQWIADGCPDGVMEGYAYKTTAAALKSRKLVKVSRKSGKWSATVTSAGAFFLEHHRYPEGHWPESTTAYPRSPFPAPKGDLVVGLSPVDQLIQDITDAGGRLEVTTHSRDYWRNLANSAVRFGKAPAGHILKVESGKDWHTTIITAEPLPEWVPTVATDIPVPATTRSLHPTVRELDKTNRRLPSKKPTRQRALRILDAIVAEAERRGYTPQIIPTTGYGSDTLAIVIHGHAIGVSLDEQTDATPHIPTKTERRDADRYSWTRTPEYDYTSSGRLTIRITTGTLVTQDKFGDGKKQHLETRLGAVLHEIELRAAAAQHQQEEQVRREREHKERWQRAYDHAIKAARHEHRVSTLLKQQEAWRRARDLTDYLDTLEQHTRTLTDTDQDTALEWITWARQTADTLNPLNQPLGIPEDPDFSSKDLEPYMRGFPPYPPSREL